MSKRLLPGRAVRSMIPRRGTVQTRFKAAVALKARPQNAPFFTSGLFSVTVEVPAFVWCKETANFGVRVVHLVECFAPILRWCAFSFEKVIDGIGVGGVWR